MRLWRHPGLRTNLLLAVFPVMFVMMCMPISYGLVLEVFEAGDWAMGVLEASHSRGVDSGRPGDQPHEAEAGTRTSMSFSP